MESSRKPHDPYPGKKDGFIVELFPTDGNDPGWPLKEMQPPLSQEDYSSKFKNIRVKDVCGSYVSKSSSAYWHEKQKSDSPLRIVRPMMADH